MPAPSILNSSIALDTGVFVAPVSSRLSMTNPKQQNCIVMPFPTGSDLGFGLTFTIPPGYGSDPVLVIKGIIDGTPANTLAFGSQQVSAAASEGADVAYEAEDTASNSTWTGYADEDMYEETITLTPSSAYVPGDIVFLRLYRDDSVDDTSFDLLLIDLLFQYTEAG